MCLGIPAKIVAIENDYFGRVDYLGTKIRVNLSLLDQVQVGDWVIIHAGFAITRLKEEEAQETLNLLREIATGEKTDL
ncbi:MAG: HypC/HybG/HupF family hydrogenase formation chaperone [Candidatus Aminicenantes bacterium]|nr:HypC/HybG/HupF family hydrogenase formation chaperone [Candidatus Aminicenantes bacterium]